jgi:hypothetical protein
VPVEYILFSDEGHGWRKTTEPDPLDGIDNAVFRGAIQVKLAI